LSFSSVAVERLFPGDVALVEIKKIKKSYIEATFVQFVKQSPLRKKAKSRHAGMSGGSPWEVISYDKQLEFKQIEVERIMKNIEADTADIKQIIGMEDPWFYRNKMQYSFGYDENMKPTLGLHVAGRKFDVYDLIDCNLAEKWMPQVVAWFRQHCFGAGLLPYHFKTGQHELRELTIRSSKKNPEQAMVILSVSGNADLDQVQAIVEKASKELTMLSSFWVEQVTTMKGRRTQKDLYHIAGSETIQEKLTVAGKELEFEIVPPSFFQPNTLQAEVIYNQVANLAGLTEAKDQIVYDLFCGTGTIGLSLAHLAKHVYGLDIVEDSIKMAEINADLNNIDNVTYVAADIFRQFKDFNWPKPDVLIIDPPRAGLQTKLIEQIAKMQPSKLIYVSCNLKSFAHDLLEFRELGWDLKSLQPIDQFPHTKHLEVVGELVRR